MTTSDESAEIRAAELVDAAQIAIRRANYERAVELLEESASLVPTNPEVAQLLSQTRQAARRHESALERNRKCLEVAKLIEERVETGETARARRMLQQATIDYGHHTSFEELDQEIGKQERTEQLRRAARLTEKARSLIKERSWRQALDGAERALDLDPHNRAAAEIRRQARDQLHSEESARQRHLAAEEAADDVERMLGAHELDEATVKLERAITLHGRDYRRFDDLARRLDHATSDLRAEQRIEWALRRSKEAEDLVAEAARSSLSGDFELAVRKLEKAASLDPSIADLEVKLTSAHSALEKQQASRLRGQELQKKLGVIRAHLRWLHLEDAASRLQEATLKFGELPEIVALRARLEHLAEAERQPRGSLSNFDLQTLSNAYSWPQVALFPLRRSQLALFALATGITLVAQVVAHPAAFALAGALLLVPFGTILLSSAAGKSSLAPIGELIGDRSLWHRWPPVLLAAAVSSLPLLLFTVSSRWHDQLAADSGAFGWILFAGLLWFAAATFLVSSAATRISTPWRTIKSMAIEILAAADLQFVGLVLIVLCQTLADGFVRAVLTALIIAYSSLVVPHIVGVLLRRTAPLWAFRS